MQESTVGGSVEKTVAENPEWLEVTTDSEDKIIEGLKSDGTRYISEIDSPTIDKLDEKIANAKIDYTHNSINGEKFYSEVNSVNPCKLSNLSGICDNSYYNIGKKYTNTSVFYAPKGDEKCKLVMSFPGGGAKSTSWYGYMQHGKILNSIGYAVLVIQGYSDEFAEDIEGRTSICPVNNWMAIEEATRAYQQVIAKYPWIDTNGVYLYGESQGGGMAENTAELSGIPILGTVLDCPTISTHYQDWDVIKYHVQAVYGMGDVYDSGLTIGYDPFERNLSEPIFIDTSVKDEYGRIYCDYENLEIKKYRSCNSPIFIMSAAKDSNQSNSVVKAYAKMLINAKNYCHFRQYDCSHGAIQYTGVVGTVNNVNITSAMVDVLEFYKRCGGYDYTFIQSGITN